MFNRPGLIKARAATHTPDKTGTIWEPWLTRDAITWLEAASLNGGRGIGLEWGAGTSTPWLAQRLSQLYTIEHNLNWFNKVKEYMSQLYTNDISWKGILLESEDEGEPFYQGSDKLFHKKYSEAPGVPDDLDFILVDGRARNACLCTAICKLKKEGGILVLDNAERKNYAKHSIPQSWDLHKTTNGIWETWVWISK